MSDRNPEYDFKWCPGCGDFGVKRALEQAIDTYTEEFEIPRTSNVIVAGIGCSGNMVHMMDGEQPFGIHGIHGRTLPIAFGVSTSRPDLNTIIVSLWIMEFMDLLKVKVLLHLRLAKLLLQLHLVRWKLR